MRIGRTVTLAGSVTSIALVLTACGGAGQETGQGGGEDQKAPQPPAQSEQAPSMNNGVTSAEDVFGPGCAQVPSDPNDPGSVQGMIDDPVGTAASNNPLLTKLTAAVGAAGLVDTLNKPDAEYTVFAPADPAFDAIPPEQLNAMLEDPAQKEKLTDILTYHVVPERMDAEGLAEAGTVKTVQGEEITIEGSGEQTQVNGANVLCGNVPTANATVFVVDEVLMPSQ